ncbi:MAG: hypothetical protein ACRD1H_15620, partial [Vicinamibacterales bacterium]
MKAFENMNNPRNGGSSAYAKAAADRRSLGQGSQTRRQASIHPSYRDHRTDGLNVGIPVASFAPVVRNVQPPAAEVKHHSAAQRHLHATARQGEKVDRGASDGHDLRCIRYSNREIDKRFD